MKSSFISSSVLVHNARMAEKWNILQQEKKELESKVKHNKFVNDLYWQERAEDNIKYNKRICEIDKLLKS